MGRVLRIGLVVVAAVALVAIVVLVRAGSGAFGKDVTAGEVTPTGLAPELVAQRRAAVAEATRAVGASPSKQILFGDLHVHSSYSLDAFQLTLPMGGGGEGTHPVSDACDFARFCSNLDFWSINDHANSLTPRRWGETIEAIRECNAVSAQASDPDHVAFLGWEWTQMGSKPSNHYGHKNVVLRDLEDGRIPTRPIAAAPPEGVPSTFDTGAPDGLLGDLLLGLGAFAIEGGHDLIRTRNEVANAPACPTGVSVHDLPEDCNESAGTPQELFAKLDEWDHASLVIPHGTVWGMYTPPGSSWRKQLTSQQHDPDRQPLVEIYSGHGNAEEYRPWVAAELHPDGTRSCPEPYGNAEGFAVYTPSCWLAGEIIRERCEAEGESVAECEARAVEARQLFVDADRNAGPWTVPGVQPEDWRDAGQCTTCFQPAFNYRAQSSVQAMLALSNPEERGPDDRPLRFRFGFIASSDNHTARAGTGYKEILRRDMTDARMAEVGRSSLVQNHVRPVAARAEAFRPEDGIPSVGFLEAERSGSFYLSGGLVAVHTESRSREAIFSALERKETYGTSGPRILLWFDLVDAGDGRGLGKPLPMGSELRTNGTPRFRVRAAGSFEELPGCPDSTRERLTPERLHKLCRGECHHPSDRRKRIDRVEVVRIRPQQRGDESLGPRIEDPWRILECDDRGQGCEVEFDDPEFADARYDAVYYARAIEAASPVVAANPLGCERDERGLCIVLDPCFDRADDDDCLAPDEQRAWSSPIFVDYAR